MESKDDAIFENFNDLAILEAIDFLKGVDIKILERRLNFSIDTVGGESLMLRQQQIEQLL